MTNESIPDDIFGLAGKVWSEADDKIIRIDSVGVIAKAISDAILAERERCAEICVARSKEHSASRHKWDDEESRNQCLQDAIEASACAIAIRRGRND